MNDWWEDLLEKISLEKIGCGIVIAAAIFGLWWFIFKSSFEFKVMIGVLVAAILYLIYNPSDRSGGDGESEDDL